MVDGLRWIKWHRCSHTWAVSGLTWQILSHSQKVAVGIDSLGACVALGMGQTVAIITVTLASCTCIVHSVACQAQSGGR